MRGHPKLRKLGNSPKYYIEWYDGTRSRRISTKTTDSTEAQKRLSEFLSGWRDGSKEPTSLERVLDAYYEEHASKLRTAENAKRCIANLKRLAGKDYAESRSVEGAADSTIRRELAVLRAAYNHAINKGLQVAMPKITLPPQGEARERWLNRKEQQKILDACESEHIRLYIHIALNTGARREAIQELTWEQVDLDAKVIHFNPHGRKQNKKKRAVVPINSELLKILKKAKKAAKTKSVLEWRYKMKNGNIFAEPAGDIKKAWQRAVKKSGVKGVQSRDLRRTAGVMMAQAGVDMKDIADILGHTDIKTTYKHYAPYSPNHARKAVEKLADSSRKLRK